MDKKESIFAYILDLFIILWYNKMDSEIHESYTSNTDINRNLCVGRTPDFHGDLAAT